MNRRRWETMWVKLGASETSATRQGETFHALTAAYSAPDRFYHNVNHVVHCLELFGDAAHLCENSSIVELAIWFHDAVYDSQASDNELRSADWAVASLREAGVNDANIIERTHRLILATRHSAAPRDADEALLLDVDLSVLGGDDAEFWGYEQAIRREYEWVKDDLFRAKRAQVLRGFLARHAIYNTPLLLERFEARARENLAAAIAQLEQTPTVAD